MFRFYLPQTLKLFCLDINVSSSIYRFIAAYRPPGAISNDVDYNDCLQTLFNTWHYVLFVGDINCPGIDWQNCYALHDGVQDVIMNLFISNGFTQYVKHATRQNNILEVALANDPFIVQTVKVGAPFANSDPCTILLTLQVADGTYSEPTNTPYKRYIWDKADFVGLNHYVYQVDWLGLMSVNLVPNDIWAAYINIIRKGVDLFVPSVIDRNNVRPNTKAKTKVKFYPNYICKAMARKQSL